MYEIETPEPSLYRCECCDGLTVRLTRYVTRDGDAFAVYFARYSNNHPDNEVAMLVSLGEWGEDSDPAQRAAFYCRVRPTEDSYEVMLADAADSVWGDAEIVGAKLSRDEARQHPWKATAFEVLDEAFVQDRSLRAFLQRAQRGGAAVPLEWSFQAPDDIFALGDEREGRVELGRSFASLDGKRFFVRCLLPVPVEDYGIWHVGVWIELAKADYDHVRKVWDDPEQYGAVHIAGLVANDVAKDLALPLPRGTRIRLHVPDTNAPPKIEATGELAKTWPKADFEAYAVARGFL